MFDQQMSPIFSVSPEANEQDERFVYIDPPFNFNAPDVAAFSPEVTGNLLLKSLCRRIGWSSLAGRKLLDFGCGVRFARTIINLAIDIDLYVGIDANHDAISWLQSEVRDHRFRFEHLDMFNPIYRPDASSTPGKDALRHFAFPEFDAACMFSVITHQSPSEAALIFSMLHPCVKLDGSLYFTAFVNETKADYVEGDISQPRHRSTYGHDLMVGLVEACGWRLEKVHPPSPFQVTAFVCRKV